MSKPISFSGSIPTNYNRYLGPLLFIPYAEDIASRVPSSATSILELACGTGLVTAQLSKRFSSSTKIIATDLNPDMIAIGKSNLTDSRIEWQVADMMQLPFDDNSFDAVVCQFGVMFVPDKLKAFKEAFRVLKKGGTFIFNTWDEIKNVEAFSIGNKVIQEFFNHNAPAFFKVPFSMYDPDELRQLMVSSGFSNIHVELVKKIGKAETSLHAAKGIIEGNPIYKEIMEINPNAIGILEEKISQQLHETFGQNPLTHSMTAFVATGTKAS
jgi:ubiquinone/menaquinone biosynthesis C-methylase UbiE